MGDEAEDAEARFGHLIYDDVPLRDLTSAPHVRSVAPVECQVVPLGGNLSPMGIEPASPETMNAALVIAGYRPGDRCTIIFRAQDDGT